MALNIAKISEEFLSILPKRSRDVLERRFGLSKKGEAETLEAIGESYGITRERVRQIEGAGLKKLRASELMQKREDVFGALKEELLKRGGISEENNFLTALTRSGGEKNQIRLLLTLHDDFEELKEDEEFHPRWTSDKKLAEASHKTLRSLHEEFSSREPVGFEELKATLSQAAKNIGGVELAEPALSSWLSISKKIGQNKLGEWGLMDSPAISPRGVRDLAYLVMKRHGSPLHFSEVAGAIKKVLGEKAHIQTVHNELIKDARFVLVGRGLYALREWGYEPGTVREVIKNILANAGPLEKDKLVEKVLKERHVKPATILINLQNKKYFKALEDGRFTVAV